MERTDSPWYPSARLFHQAEPGDWDRVIADVVAALTPPAWLLMPRAAVAEFAQLRPDLDVRIVKDGLTEQQLTATRQRIVGARIPGQAMFKSIVAY